MIQILLTCVIMFCRLRITVIQTQTPSINGHTGRKAGNYFNVCIFLLYQFSRDLPGKIFDVPKVPLLLIAMGLLAKIWGHFLYVIFKAN